MSTPKDIKDELVEDLEATDEEAENVKGGTAKHVKHVKHVKRHGGLPPVTP